MKKMFLLWVAFAAASNAQDLRLIRGKVYDFTQAQAAGPASAYSNFWVNARLIESYPKFSLFRVSHSHTEIQFTGTPPLSGGGDLLHYLAGRQLASNPRGISTGSYYSLDPELRRNFTPMEVTATVKVVIFNYDPPAGALQTNISLCVLPLGKITMKGFGESFGYDYGVPYIASAVSNEIVYALRPSGIIPYTDTPSVPEGSQLMRPLWEQTTQRTRIDDRRWPSNPPPLNPCLWSFQFFDAPNPSRSIRRQPACPRNRRLEQLLEQ